jgi:hypothetical protein
MEGFGPATVADLNADEVVSRLLKQTPPAKDAANVVRHHEGIAWLTVRLALGDRCEPSGGSRLPCSAWPARAYQALKPGSGR